LEGEPAELSIIDAGAGATGTSHWPGLDFPGDYVGYGHRGGGNSDWDFDLGTTVASGCSELNLFWKAAKKNQNPPILGKFKIQETARRRKIQKLGNCKTHPQKSRVGHPPRFFELRRWSSTVLRVSCD
jgi:hypothetical protein